MMRRLFYILSFVLLLNTSCKFTREVKESSETNVSEFSHASEDATEIDSNVEKTAINYIRSDSSSIKLLLACDSLNKVYLKEIISYKSGKNISIPVNTIKGNILTSTCKIDSFAVYSILKLRYTLNAKKDLSEASHSKESNTITSKVTNTKIPYIVIIASLIGIVVLILFIKKYILWKG